MPAPTPPVSSARGGFLGSVLVLVGGTALAHFISAAALPVLARIYTPADFGLLAVFAGLLSIVSVAACLRYDVAVPIPKQDEDGLNLLALAICSAAAISSLLAVPVLLAPAWLAKKLGQPAIASQLWLLPVGVMLAGTYSALQFWYVRHQRFDLIARTRVAQSACATGTQIGLGHVMGGPLGLLVGYVMNSGIACTALGIHLLRTAPKLSLSRMRSMAYQYRRFPKYSTFEALASSAAIQLPIIAVAALAAPSEAGYLMMAMYVMQMPMALIGTAISQVYLSRAPDEFRNGTLAQFTTNVVAGLVKTGFGPLLAAGILSPLLFSVVLGAEWQRAGYLVAWMTPWFIMQFLSVPVSMALHITNHQRVAMALQVAGIIVRLGAVWLAAQYWRSNISEIYAVSGFVFYSIYLAVILKITATNTGNLLGQSIRGWPHIFGWVAFSGGTAALLQFLR